MTLDAYWPIPDEVNRCIKAEAEAAPDAVLMAVHQPTPLIQREVGSGLETPATEQALLDAFLTDNLPQGTLLMPVTGPSGAGKSHLIRWLAAQLSRDPRAHHLHVIRIPKSANLREVVERVLAPLAGDERFAEVLASLNRVVDAVKPQDAALRFATELQIALRDLHDRLMAELRAASPEARSAELKVRADHAKKLPGLFSDSALQEHMTGKVLVGIIQRAVSGRDLSADESEERLPQFGAADLELPDEFRSALVRASEQVNNYYRIVLNRADGKGREEAAAVLNEVRDQAISQVFGLHQAINGVTLQEIILRIRELMLQDNRELVLLIEDFAALGGIQQVLLDVCIKEGIYSGRQTLSHMRTALAVTDGYVIEKDTFATRAKYEWVIQSRGSQDKVIARTVELAGAYLNAARWGEAELTRRFREGAQGTDLTGWVEVFQDLDQTEENFEQLSAFGDTASHTGIRIPLFPFNEAALRHLAERHLREAGELRFNPRRVINFVLRDVLLMRDDYERGCFPPPGFQDAKPSARIAVWLTNQSLSEEKRRRLDALIFYWGGHPQTPEQVAEIAPALFDTFGLPRPTGLPESKVPTKTAKTAGEAKRPTDKRGATTEIAAPPIDPFLAEWNNKLDAWSGGAQMGQSDALHLRRAINPFVERAVSWNDLRMRKRPLSLLLTIPNALGNQAPAMIRLPIADNYSDPTGDLRSTLLGAIRLDRAKGGLNYPEADEDSARLATLVERLVAKLIPQLEDLRDQEVKALAWVLARQARVLGLVPRRRMSKLEARMCAVLATVESPNPPDAAPPPEEPRWQRLRREAATQRPELLRMLQDRIGCFQGNGPTPYAVDPTLVNLADEADAPDLAWLSATQREPWRQVSPAALRVAIRPQEETLRSLSARLDTLLGPQRDKQGLARELKDLMEKLQSAGAFPDGYHPPARFRQEINAFGDDNLMDQLGEAGPLLDAENVPSLALEDTLDRLGRIDFDVIGRAAKFLDRAEGFLDGAEQRLAVKEQGLAGVDPVADAEALAQALDQIYRDLCTLTGGEPE